ncbi:MAG: CoA ester lyase [Alphaproteobacteria bacterium]|nr:CoA ester lyase [Alphaproteobacteria bacterium]
MGPYRSFLFAPGNHPRKVEKVFDVGADGVILDLEDAVANDEKTATREVIVAALQRPRRNLGYVRVNSFETEFCFGDLEAIVGKGLDGIVLPMVESASQLLAVDWMLANLERKTGLEIGKIDLVPILETGKGIAALPEIAGCGSRVRRMAFGAGDYSLDMNMEWTLDEVELDGARARMVLASRAADLEPPLDTVWIHIKDLEGLRKSSERAKRMGFQGKMCIYPPQVAVVNEVYSPGAAEVEHAERVVAAFAEAEKAGSSSIQLDGYFIDYPIVYKAQRILDAAKVIQDRDAG